MAAFRGRDLFPRLAKAVLEEQSFENKNKMLKNTSATGEGELATVLILREHRPGKISRAATTKTQKPDSLGRTDGKDLLKSFYPEGVPAEMT